MPCRTSFNAVFIVKERGRPGGREGVRQLSDPKSTCLWPFEDGCAREAGATWFRHDYLPLSNISYEAETLKTSFRPPTGHLKAKILLLQHAKSAQKFAARAIDANRAVVAAMHPPDAGTARLARVDGFPRT